MIPVITAPLDPVLDVDARGRLKERLADEWRAEHDSEDPVAVDLLPAEDR